MFPISSMEGKNRDQIDVAAMCRSMYAGPVARRERSAGAPGQRI